MMNIVPGQLSSHQHEVAMRIAYDAAARIQTTLFGLPTSDVVLVGVSQAGGIAYVVPLDVVLAAIAGAVATALAPESP